MAEYMCNMELQAQRVSLFSQHVRYDYSNHAQEEPAPESGLSPREVETHVNPQPDGEALAVEDKWVLSEPKCHMIRVHRKLRSQ